MKRVSADKRFQLQVLDSCLVHGFDTAVENFFPVGQGGDALFKDDFVLKIRQGYPEGGDGDGKGIGLLLPIFAFNKLNRQAAHAYIDHRPQLNQFGFAKLNQAGLMEHDNGPALDLIPFPFASSGNLHFFVHAVFSPR